MSLPSSLLLRTVLGALLLLFIAAAGLRWVHVHELMLEHTTAFAEQTAHDSIELAQRLNSTPIEQRGRVLAASLRSDWQVRILNRPVADQTRQWPHADDIRDEVRASLPPRVRHVIELHFGVAGQSDRWIGWRSPRQLTVAVKLQPTGWLNVTADASSLANAGRRFRAESLGMSITLLLAASIVTIWLSQRTVRPLLILANAANRMGTTFGSVLPASNSAGNAAGMTVGAAADPAAESFAPIPEQGGPELRQTIRAFNAMQTRIQSLLNERSLMTAALSHDLRTALTRLELRLEEIPDEKEREWAVRDVHWMVEILDDTLLAVRTHAAARESFDLAQLLRDLVEQYMASPTANSRTREDPRTAAPTEAPQISLDVAAALPMLGSAVGMQRTCANLVSNAIRYGNRADIRAFADDNAYCIEIKDDGPGIPNDEKDKVFQPFYRCEASRSRTTGGIGLGLSVVQRVVSQHGGSVQMVDAPSGGNIARIRLPIRPRSD